MHDSDLAFYLRVMRCNENHALVGDLWWRTDEQYAPITFILNCNDVFWWGVSDCVDISPENIHLLEKSIEDAGEYASTLFCARMRQMRPQGAMYKHIPKKLHQLFDDCGPERPIEFGNPFKQQ